MFNLLLAAIMILPPVQQTSTMPASEPAPFPVSWNEAENHALNHDLLCVRTAHLPHFRRIIVTVVVNTEGSVISAVALPQNQLQNQLSWYPADDMQFAPLIQAEELVRGMKFKPFYRYGKPVSVTFERYVDTRPLERMSDQHVPFPKVRNWNSIKISLERTVCSLGRCPAYKVELHGDGTVLYEGQNNVEVMGSQRASVPQANVVELMKLFDQADYYSLLSLYESGGSNILSTVTTSIEIDGQRKQVREYAGLEAGMPLSVVKLEDAIDHLSGDTRWVHSQVPQ